MVPIFKILPIEQETGKHAIISVFNIPFVVKDIMGVYSQGVSIYLYAMDSALNVFSKSVIDSEVKIWILKCARRSIIS